MITCQCILCVTTGYHVYHTLLALPSFNKAWLCSEKHRCAICAFSSFVTLEADTQFHTHRYVGEGTAGMGCPDVFGVRVTNNGRVLAAAISHQVLHVAVPGHVCGISSKMRQTKGQVESQTSLERRRNCEEAVFISGLTGLQQAEPPGSVTSRLSSGLGNEEKPLESDRRLGVVLAKSLRLGRCSPGYLIA